ncbi:MAG TPA: DUF1573 domain-containing protein [Planctomycetes bacterium]|nr:DUF1573 domain-containing protein [Planctomycetota bacterium]HIK82288.1 DUF1573 domain-containing protein [Planctomycetota bacterium]
MVADHDDQIPPGGVGTVTVTLDAKKARGKNITKTVTVFSNDPENPEYKLSIKGTILEILETRPLALKLQGLAGGDLSNSFTFTAGSPLDVEIVEIKSRGSLLDIGELEEVIVGREWNLSLTAKANARPALIKEKLVMEVLTSDGEERTLDFLVQVDHRPRIVLQPKQNLKFLNRETSKLLGGGEPLEKSILVTGGDKTVEFEVTGVLLDPKIADAFQTRIEVVSPQKSYRVWVTLSEYQSKPTVLGKLKIQTNDKVRSEISVWVMGQFRQAAKKTSR